MRKDVSFHNSPLTVPVTWTRTLKIFWSWFWRILVYSLILEIALHFINRIAVIPLGHLLAGSNSFPEWLTSITNAFFWFFNYIRDSHLSTDPDFSFFGYALKTLLIEIPFGIYALKRVVVLHFKVFSLGFVPEVLPGTPQYRRNLLTVWWHWFWPVELLGLVFMGLAFYSWNDYLEILEVLIILVFSVFILKHVLTKGYGTIRLLR